MRQTREVGICLRHSCLVERPASPSLPEKDVRKLARVRRVMPLDVTDGNLLRGVRFTGDGVLTQSVVMTSSTPKVRFIETTHLENKPDVKVRFR